MKIVPPIETENGTWQEEEGDAEPKKTSPRFPLRRRFIYVHSSSPLLLAK